MDSEIPCTDKAEDKQIPNASSSKNDNRREGESGTGDGLSSFLEVGSKVKKRNEDSYYLGYCKHLEITAEVQVVGKEGINLTVKGDNLRSLQAFKPGIIICLDTWIGKIEYVKTDLVVRFADGSRCLVLREDVSSMDDTTVKKSGLQIPSSFHHYVGQKLTGSMSSFRNASWINKSEKIPVLLHKPTERVNVIVEDVRVTSCLVKKFLRASMVNDIIKLNVDYSDCIIEGDDLNRVQIISNNRNSQLLWMPGGKYLYDLKEADIRKMKEENNDPSCSSSKKEENKAAENLNEDLRISKTRKEESDLSNEQDVLNLKADIKFGSGKHDLKQFLDSAEQSLKKEVVVEIVNTTTKAKVVWQNGNVEELLSSDLELVRGLLHLEHFPGDLIVDSSTSGQRYEYGVVKYVNHSERMLIGEFFKIGFSHQTEPEPSQEREVSFYHTKPYYLHIYPGTQVLKIQNLNDIDSSSFVGSVTAIYTSGKAEVKWVNGSKSLCYPYELRRLDECLLQVMCQFEPWTDEDDLDSISSTNVKESQEKDPKPYFSLESRPGFMMSGIMKELCEIHKRGKKVDKFLGTSHFQEGNILFLAENLKEKGDSLRLQEGFGTITTPANECKIAASKDTIQDVTVPPDPLTEASANEFRNQCFQFCHFLRTMLLKTQHDIANTLGLTLDDLSENLSCGRKRSYLNLIEELLNDPTPKDREEKCSPLPSLPRVSPSISESSGLKKFVLVDNVPSSHKFKSNVFEAEDQDKFLNIVEREVETLTNCLPDGIYVKGFKDRADLYSAMFVGPSMTPYEDCLFFFDFQLPADYSKSPPHCYYVSYCRERIHPCLYETGLVGHSLLGTCYGEGNDLWSLSTSNLLQVLLAIQNLFVAEPYFNEPGIVRKPMFIFDAENSKIYNEMVIVNLARSMSKILESPHESFTQEILIYMTAVSPKYVSRIQSCCERIGSKKVSVLDENKDASSSYVSPLEGSMSRGFGLALGDAVSSLKKILNDNRISFEEPQAVKV